jgi:hypothetical protein
MKNNSDILSSTSTVYSIVSERARLFLSLYLSLTSLPSYSMVTIYLNLRAGPKLL